MPTVPTSTRIAHSMTAQEAKPLLTSLLSDAEKGCELAKTAARNRKSLAGDNSYGNRFHTVSVALSTTEGKLGPFVAGLELASGDVAAFRENLAVLKSE